MEKQLISFEDANAVLAVDGNAGIYAPQQFAKRYLSNDMKSAYPQLIEGPDNGDYWDVWEEVSEMDVMINGECHRVYEHEGNIWLIPSNVFGEIDWDAM